VRVLAATLAHQNGRVPELHASTAVATPAPETLAAPRRTPEPQDSVVAGGRNARVCRALRLSLPVAGKVAA
jgi:hypothetical protein